MLLACAAASALGCLSAYRAPELPAAQTASFVFVSQRARVSRSIYAPLTVQIYDHGQSCPGPFGHGSRAYRGSLESPPDGAPLEVVVPAPHWIFLRIYRNAVVIDCTLDVGFRPEPGHHYAIEYRYTGSRCIATAQDVTTDEPVVLSSPGKCEG